MLIYPPTCRLQISLFSFSLPQDRLANYSTRKVFKTEKAEKILRQKDVHLVDVSNGKDVQPHLPVIVGATFLNKTSIQ